MSNIGNKYKIGALVMVSGILLIFGLIMLGVMKYFKESIAFMTVVETSVQGLNKGSMVKYKGVPIGEVSKIQISQTDDNILIYMNFNPDSFSSAEKEEIKLQGGMPFLENEFKKYVDQGMRCKLKYAGITGELYVEVAMYDPEKFPPKSYKLPDDHPPYLPSVPQTSLGDVLDAAHDSLINLTKIDFGKISGKLETFLDSINGVIKDGDIKKTMTELRTTSENLSEMSTTLKNTFTTERIDDIVKKIDDTSAKLNMTLDQITKLAKNMDGRIDESKIPETVEAARKLIDDAVKSLKSLDEFIRSAKELMDYLEEHPNSVITGKSEQPVLK